MAITARAIRAAAAQLAGNVIDTPCLYSRSGEHVDEIIRALRAAGFVARAQGVAAARGER